MKPADELYVGIDLGATNVRAAVVDAVGHVLGQEKHRLLSREPPQVAEAVVRASKTACGASASPPPVRAAARSSTRPPVAVPQRYSGG